jgi:hypothetical protein
MVFLSSQTPSRGGHTSVQPSFRLSATYCGARRFPDKRRSRRASNPLFAFSTRLLSQATPARCAQSDTTHHSPPAHSRYHDTAPAQPSHTHPLPLCTTSSITRDNHFPKGSATRDTTPSHHHKHASAPNCSAQPTILESHLHTTIHPETWPLSASSSVRRKRLEPAINDHRTISQHTVSKITHAE